MAGGNYNPTGKGGFGERPWDINRKGYWWPEHSISYQYKHLLKLTVKELKEWEKEFPEDKRTNAQDIAYKAIIIAKYDFNYLKEVTDRTEGKAPQSVDLTTKGDALNSNFTDDQIYKIATRIARRGTGASDTKSKK